MSMRCSASPASCTSRSLHTVADGRASTVAQRVQKSTLWADCSFVCKKSRAEAALSHLAFAQLHLLAKSPQVASNASSNACTSARCILSRAAWSNLLHVLQLQAVAESQAARAVAGLRSCGYWLWHRARGLAQPLPRVRAGVSRLSSKQLECRSCICNFGTSPAPHCTLLTAADLGFRHNSAQVASDVIPVIQQSPWWQRLHMMF